MPHASAFGILRMSLFACAGVTLALGIFALAGDRLGLWKPLPDPGGQATAVKRQVQAARAESVAGTAPGPPMPADLALLVGGVAAAVAVLASVRFRVFRLSRSALAHVSVGAPGWMRPRNTMERLRPALRRWMRRWHTRERLDAGLRALVRGAWWFDSSYRRAARAFWVWSAQTAFPAVRSRVPRPDVRAIADSQRDALRSFARGSGRLATSGGHVVAASLQLVGAGTARVVHFRYRRHVSRSRRQDIAWGVCAAMCALVVAFVVVTFSPR
jgi:hypothetical protein